MKNSLTNCSISTFAANEPYGHHSSSPACQTCYTPTTYVTEIVPCPAQPTPCPPHPLCLLLTSTVIPSKVCKTTTTLTTNQCTFCQIGCGTATTTLTATDYCVTPSPSTCSYSTVTETSGNIFCPFIPGCTTSNCATTQTVTQPPENLWCTFTPTVTVGPTCPTGDQACCPTIKTTVTAKATTAPPSYGKKVQV